MANPSTSSSESMKLPKIAIIAGGVAVAASIGFAAYYAYKSNKPKYESVINLAEKKKKEGNDLYRKKDYFGAIKVFNESISALKSAESNEEVKGVLANCYNNISACCEILSDVEGSVKYCSEAIAINPKYLKVLNRRARLYEKIGKHKEALDDFFTITSLCSTEDQFKTLNLDVERVLHLAIEPELKRILEQSENTFKLIPQFTITQWLCSTVTNDPIVHRLNKINSVESITGNSLDSALLILKKGKYDEVLPAVLKIMEQDNFGVSVEGLDDNQKFENYFVKGAMILLAARLYNLHNQKNYTLEYAEKFDSYFNELDNEVQSKLLDLRVAYFVLMITIADTDANAAEIVEQSLTVSPTNADPLTAYGCRFIDVNDFESALAAFTRVLSIDPNHSYAKYYIMYLEYVTALKMQAIDQVRSSHYTFDDTLNKDTNPPIFALLLFAKLCLNSENGELALQTVKKVLKIMPDNAFALYLCGVLDCDAGLNITDTARMKDYVNTVKKVMNKVIKVDPNYWEPYRTLAKICLDKMEFAEAIKYYDKAITLARTREELEMILKDKFLTELTAVRVKDGRGVPFVFPSTNS